MSFLPTAGKLPGFIFGPGTDVPTYDALRKRREVADTLAQQALGGAPRNMGEGIAAVGRALAARYADTRLKPQEKAETDRAGSRLMEIAGLLTGRGGSSPVMSSMGGAPEAPGTTTGVAPEGFRAPSVEPMSLAKSMIGKGEVPDRATLQEYLKNGGQNLDPATTAWCAAFVNASLVQGGVEGTGSNMARSFLDWGSPVEQPQPGDIAVLSRGDPNGPLGHVGFYQGVGPDGQVQILGGNQGDAVSVAGFDPASVLGYRRAGAAQPGGLGSAGVSFDPALIAELGQLAGNPYMNDGQKLVAQALLQRAMGSSDAMTPYQQAQLALDQDRLAFDREKFAQGTREGPKYYGNTQWATDPETGAWRPYQIGTDGSVNWLDLGGAQPMPPTRSADLGTEIVPVGPGGVPTGTTLEKDNRGAEREKGIGKAQGEAIGAAATGLSNATAKAQQAVDLIDSIAGDPSLAGITGMVQGRLPPLTQAGTDLNAKIDQLRGKVFLEAFESLKGGGAITEIEGQKAEQAIARLQRAQSHEEFVAALTELRGVIAAGVERMRAKAAPAAPAGAAPTDMPQSAIDAGIDPALWQYLDENQRALWSN